MNPVSESVKSLTSVLTISSKLESELTPSQSQNSAPEATEKNSQSNDDQIWSKALVSKVKLSSSNEKTQLRELNSKLKNYITDVRILEDKNKYLLDELNKAKLDALASLNNPELEKELSLMRTKLEDELKEKVTCPIRIDHADNLKNHLMERIAFFEKEGLVNKEMINQLQNRLKEVSTMRENLVISAEGADSEIERERNKQQQAETQLENLRKTLSANKFKNKKVELEKQSLTDEIKFRKGVFQEEKEKLESLKSALNSANVPGLNNFYKNELDLAIRDIRSNFENLNQQKMSELKEMKEKELEYTVKMAQGEILKSKQNTEEFEKKNLEILKLSNIGNKDELGELKKENINKEKRLLDLEKKLNTLKERNKETINKLVTEIALLNEQNQTKLKELDDWELNTKDKLETEIQTYRSILYSQLRFLEMTKQMSDIPVKSSPPPPPPTPSAPGEEMNRPTIPRAPPLPPSLLNPILQKKPAVVSDKTFTADPTKTLRQVFDFIDINKNGRINSIELDKVFTRLNIRLSPESYDRILKEANNSPNKSLDFNEFCKIMMPVFTGKFEDDELRYAFKKIDVNNSGYISVQELQSMLSKIGQHHTDEQISRMIASVDIDRDGRLNYLEFTQLIRTMKYD